MEEVRATNTVSMGDGRSKAARRKEGRTGICIVVDVKSAGRVTMPWWANGTIASKQLEPRQNLGAIVAGKSTCTPFGGISW